MTTATLHRRTVSSPRPKDPRPPTCAEHRSRRAAGCPNCRRHAAWYKRLRQRAIADGTWQPLQPVGPLADHVRALMDGGWEQGQIADRAGLPLSVVQRVAARRIKRGVHGVTAEALLGVTGPAPATPARYVPALGTHRRLQALSAIGWTREAVAEKAGTTLAAIQQYLEKDQVLATTAERIKQVYEALSAAPGTNKIARGRARYHCYAPPLAWEGVDIDDPAAQPVLDAQPGADADAYDPVTVAFAVEGRLTYEQIKAHRPDLIETVRRLARTLGDHEIARHLHWPGADENRDGSKRNRGQNTVCNFRKRNNIPGPEKHEAVYAYGTRSRARTPKAA